MILNIDGVKYRLKQSFNEYTFAEFMPIAMAAEKPVMERLNVYTGIPIDLLSKMPLTSVGQLCGLMEFAENTEVLNALAEPYEGKPVGLETYLKMEKAKRACKDNSLFEALPAIVKIYTDIDISDKPLLEVWNMAIFYLDSMGKFFTRFKRLGDYKYSDIELEAGVEVFEGFGYFSTVVKIGRERGKTNDEVLAMTAEEVYMEMLLDFEKSEYAERFRKISEQYQEHFSKVK